MTFGKTLFHIIAAACLMTGPATAAAPVTGLSPEMAAWLRYCAPTVHPETMAAVVSAESRGHQFALADAGPKHLPWSERKALVRSFYFGSIGEAAGAANALIAAGHTVSLGPAQINDRNLARLGLSVEAVLEPCTNLAAGGRILTDFYVNAAKQFGAGPRALRAALSAYNSGSWLRGEKDGYVDLVIRQVGKPLVFQTGRRAIANAGAGLIVPAARRGERVGRGDAAATPSRAGRGATFALSAKEFAIND